MENRGTYRAVNELPALVTRAARLAEALEFRNSCISEVGRLLRVLVASAGPGVIAEVGTGCGVGSAWMLSGLRAGQTFVSIELDMVRHREVSDLFADVPNATFLTGDWRDLLAYAPFKLLFADGGKAKEEGAALLLEALELGGAVVLDDLTPEDQWPEAWRGQKDETRAFWLNHPNVQATEILTTPKTAAIIAVRVR